MNESVHMAIGIGMKTDDDSTSVFWGDFVTLAHYRICTLLHQPFLFP
jgi:hypothetical protein